jgi:hypothetical protein
MDVKAVIAVVVDVVIVAIVVNLVLVVVDNKAKSKKS